MPSPWWTPPTRGSPARIRAAMSDTALRQPSDADAAGDRTAAFADHDCPRRGERGAIPIALLGCGRLPQDQCRQRPFGFIPRRNARRRRPDPLRRSPSHCRHLRTSGERQWVGGGARAPGRARPPRRPTCCGPEESKSPSGWPPVRESCKSTPGFISRRSTRGICCSDSTPACLDGSSFHGRRCHPKRGWCRCKRAIAAERARS